MVVAGPSPSVEGTDASDPPSVRCEDGDKVLHESLRGHFPSGRAIHPETLNPSPSGPAHATFHSISQVHIKHQEVGESGSPRPP